jgi:hypothetical protein
VKYFLSTLIALVSFTSGFAADEWVPYLENGEITILYRYSECHDDTNGIRQEKVLLKFVNSGVDKKEISFSKELKYDGTLISTDEKTFAIILSPNESREGSCPNRDKTLSIFSKFLNFKARELTNFELKNVSVKTVE